MVGPRKKYRQRPKKCGAKKTQRLKSQKQRLMDAGMKEEEVHKLSTDGEIRDALKKVMKKK